MASETTPELEALVVGLFEVGAVKVRAWGRTCMRAHVHACHGQVWVEGFRV